MVAMTPGIATDMPKVTIQPVRSVRLLLKAIGKMQITLAAMKRGALRASETARTSETSKSSDTTKDRFAIQIAYVGKL